MLETAYVLNILKKISHNIKLPVFLAGGFVRDYYLGVDSVDLDIVLEKSRDIFIENLSNELDIEKIIYHEDFGTAALYLENYPPLDVAFARKEIYPFPGSLPLVTFPVSIEEDLKRRDFSINAMAIDISKENLSILDPLKGLTDLNLKQLRILHPESFKDDPTRIFRGIRFAARWDFKFEKTTEDLLKKAVIRNYLFTVSKDRIMQEFFLILSERNFISSLWLLKKYDLFRFIHPALRFNRGILKKTRKIYKFPSLIKSLDLEKHILILLCLMHKKSVSEKVSFLQTLNFPNKLISSLVWMQDDELKVLDALKKADKNSQIFEILKNCSSYFLYFIFIRAGKKEQKKIRKFMFNLKRITAIIDGKILISLDLKPGRKFKEILEKAFLIQLDMKYPSEKKILEELKLT